MTHYEYTQKNNPPQPCTAAHQTFGGRCLNCGYEPDATKAATSKTKVKRYPYLYRPGLLDLLHPTVIKGEPIAAGSNVRIAREFNPPMYPTKVFAMIEDANGNVQSVYRAALVREK